MSCYLNHVEQVFQVERIMGDITVSSIRTENCLLGATVRRSLHHFCNSGGMWTFVRVDERKESEDNEVNNSL